MDSKKMWLVVVVSFISVRCVLGMVEPVPVEKWNPTEVVGSEAMQWWNAKLPDVNPPTLYWPLVDQAGVSDMYSPGEAGAEVAQAAASEAAKEQLVKPYVIPEYPLPPSPQSAPPPTMPFANLDLAQSTVMGITPPEPVIGEGNIEGEGEGGSESSHLKNDDVKDGSTGIPYETPPMKEADAMAFGGSGAPGGASILGVDPKVFNRRDSPNSYCDICVAAFGNSIFSSGCESLPSRLKKTCEHVDSILAQNTDFITLKTEGCVDKTGPTPIEHMPGPAEARCPPLVACNMLQGENELPMCGERWRSWGDFLPGSAMNRPMRPDFPVILRGPNFAPPPYLGVYEGNPYCNVCAGIMNSMKMKDLIDLTKLTRDKAEEVCIAFPNSLRYLCMEFLPKLMASPGFKDVEQNGCIDVTKTSKGEDASPCPGLVACNAIASKSGRPMCGQKIGEWGFRTSDWENPKGTSGG
jgi:hypothetical protein